MPIVRKAMAYASICTQSWRSQVQMDWRSPGFCTSRISRVAAIAMTPSLKASNRPVVMAEVSRWRASSSVTQVNLPVQLLHPVGEEVAFGGVLGEQDR